MKRLPVPKRLNVEPASLAERPDTTEIRQEVRGQVPLLARAKWCRMLVYDGNHPPPNAL